jgi:hypothetical protein
MLAIIQSKIFCLPVSYQTNLKIKIYRTVILPIVLYGCKTWSLIVWEEHRLRVCENKVLRKILGPKREEDGSWRKLCSNELYSLYSSPNIVRVITARRMRWAGHIVHWDQDPRAPSAQPVKPAVAENSLNLSHHIQLHDTPGSWNLDVQNPHSREKETGLIPENMYMEGLLRKTDSHLNAHPSPVLFIRMGLPPPELLQWPCIAHPLSPLTHYYKTLTRATLQPSPYQWGLNHAPRLFPALVASCSAPPHPFYMPQASSYQDCQCSTVMWGSNFFTDISTQPSKHSNDYILPYKLVLNKTVCAKCNTTLYADTVSWKCFTLHLYEMSLVILKSLSTHNNFCDTHLQH